MDKLFITKLKNQEYISKHLFNSIDQLSSNIPLNFDLEKYNNIILEKELIKHKDYFDNMYQEIDPNIKLDTEQRKAILSDEDFSLIIAGAGTGKTTTMASKVKYLVDKKNISPEKILVMSFTKKATQELEKRICYDFNIPAKVTTFHSLGYMHIREIFHNRKCYIVDKNIRNKIFYNYFKEQIFPDKNKVKEIIDLYKNISSWLFSKHFQTNYEKYKSYEDYFKAYKEYKISEFKDEYDLSHAVKSKIDNSLNQENIITIKDELVKSKGEAIIANFLFCNGIDYQYEKIYDELMDENKIYKPDFTLELHGQNVYIEYFGFSDSDPINNKKYQRIKELKENYHKEHHNIFISINYDDQVNIVNYLYKELTKLGFKFKPLSSREIYDAILSNDPLHQISRLSKFFYNMIDIIKTSSKRENYQNIINEYVNSLPLNEKEEAKRQIFYINDFYLYYQKNLYGSEEYGFDFSDLIYYANKYISNVGTNNNLNFEYIIIDEYQDISQERYEFTKNIADRNHAKIVAVGDDWQSIYGFSGSKVDYTYNFQKYFKDSNLLKISNTYRNSQSLIDYSGKFIMRNETQIKKDLYSNKNLSNPIRFEMYDEEIESEYEALKRVILKIHQNNPTHKIMILARNNSMINKCFNEIDLIDDIGTKITFVGYEDIDIDGMTIHKSKGLTCDEVIVFGLNNSFPHTQHNLFWLEGLFKPPLVEESIPYAEERRLFYVALTRTKNYVYLLANKNAKYRSPFVDELAYIVDEIEKEKNKDLEVI